MTSEPSVGAWRDDGWSVIAHCKARGCAHSAELDLIEIADSHGRTLASNTLCCKRSGDSGGTRTVVTLRAVGASKRSQLRQQHFRYGSCRVSAACRIRAI
jgi:hypothetical protein